MIETSSDIPGIRQIDYQLQSLDYTGKPIDGKFNATPYTKTLIDEANHPGLTAKVEQWGKEALANGQYGKGNGSQIKFVGTASNGLQFEGWYNPTTKIFDSFYPKID